MRRRNYIIIVLLLLIVGCVTVRVITGKDNQYEGGSEAESNTGIESNINKRDSI